MAMEESCFDDLMLQQAYLHNEIDRAHKNALRELQEEVRRLKDHLNCARLSSSRDSEESDSDADIRDITENSEMRAHRSESSSGSSTSFSGKQHAAMDILLHQAASDEQDIEVPGGVREEQIAGPTLLMPLVDLDKKKIPCDVFIGVIPVPATSSLEEPSPPSICPPVVSPDPIVLNVPAKPFTQAQKRWSDSKAKTMAVVKFAHKPQLLLPNPDGANSAQPVRRRSVSQIRNSFIMGENSVADPDSNAQSRVASRRPSRQINPNMSGLLQAAQTLGEGLIEPWPVWYDVSELANMQEAPRDAIHRKSMTERMTRLQHMRKMSKSVDFHLLEQGQSKFGSYLQMLVVHPSSPKRLAWVCIGMVLIIYDLIMLPMGAFDLPVEALASVMSWVMALFWSADMVCNFFVGFHVRGGELEKRLRNTALTYARSWFAVDLILVLIDWSCIALDAEQEGTDRSSASSARIIKSVRAMRALRSMRLLRVVKVPQAFKEITTSFGRSEYASLCFGIVKQIFIILIVNHVLACCWFYIGKENSKGWVKTYMVGVNDWQDLYLTSLHWSLAQFTPAPHFVQPQTIAERLFTVTVIVFALITFSSFVSSITNLMTHLRMLKSVESKQFSKLERYLHDNHISFHLSLRVRRFLEHSVYEAKKKPQEKDVDLLFKLSEPLRMELHYEVYSPTVSKHPFFMNYMQLNLPAMQKLCHSCIRGIQLSTDDILFNSGEQAKAIYFVNTGELEYTRSGARGDISALLCEGSWCSEMVLWTPWEHRGAMKAKTECFMTGLDSASFHKVVIDTKAGQLEASAYAIEAVRILNENFESSEYTDLDGGNFDAFQICMQIFKNATKNNKHWLHSGNRMSEGLGSEGFLERTGLAKNLRISITKPASMEDSMSSQASRNSQSSQNSSQSGGSP